MKLEKAKDIAVKICYQLQPYCDKINIAGSIRRKKSEVKDIEIICVPKLDIVCQDNLFGEQSEGIKILSEGFIKTVTSLGNIKKGKPEGKMMQIELPEWIMLDLFIPDDFDYYRQYAIRTGSAIYSHQVIAAGWLKIGWCGVSGIGLRRQSDCEGIKQPDGKIKWKLINKEGEKPPVWESEKEFFDWLKVPFINPVSR